MFGFLRKPQQVAEVRSADASAAAGTGAGFSFLHTLLKENAAGVDDYLSAFTNDQALGIPAVSCAVAFLSKTIASLPLKVYEKDGEAKKRVTDDIAEILGSAVSDTVTSFEWREGMLLDVLSGGGRSMTFINRNASGRIVSLDALDPNSVTARRRSGKVTYHYTENGRLYIYDATEIIDVPYMLRPDRLGHRDPIMMHRQALAMAHAAMVFGGRFFASGAVPPYIIQGGFQGVNAMARAAEDFDQAIKQAIRENRPGIATPNGVTVSPLALNAEDAQMIEAQVFMVQQVARVFGLPPVFLHDLSTGTYSNTEQQDIHLVKHTVSHWAGKIEAQLNLKLFGRRSKRWCEFDLDGLQRGDFVSRMGGLSQAVQNALLTPNEGRALMNRPPLAGGEKLFVQGATVPIDAQQEQNTGNADGA